MATMYVRNGKHYVNYAFNGQRVRRSLGSNKRDAEVYFKELKYRLFKGDIKPDKPQISVDCVVRKYLENCQKRLAPSTHIRYVTASSHFTEFLVNCSPVQYLDQITRTMLIEYLDFRVNESIKPKSNTVNQELTIVRAMLNFVVDSGYIENNPAKRMRLLRTDDARKGRLISEKEIELLIRGCNQIKDGEWLKNVLLTYLNTGMRRGELLNLTWHDIDLGQNPIRIRNKPFWKPKSGNRSIPINRTVQSILRAFRRFLNTPKP